MLSVQAPVAPLISSQNHENEPIIVTVVQNNSDSDSTCLICGETQEKMIRIKQYNHSSFCCFENEEVKSWSCEHEFCEECLKSWVSFHLSEGKVRVFCPAPCCKTELAPTLIKQLTQTKFLQNYEEALLFELVKIPKNLFQLCPKCRIIFSTDCPSTTTTTTTTTTITSSCVQPKDTTSKCSPNFQQESVGEPQEKEFCSMICCPNCSHEYCQKCRTTPKYISCSSFDLDAINENNRVKAVSQFYEQIIFKTEKEKEATTIRKVNHSYENGARTKTMKQTQLVCAANTQEQESREEVENELMESVLLSSRYKRCPSCFVPIELAGTGSHLQCFQCKANFCWKCLTKFVFRERKCKCN